MRRSWIILLLLNQSLILLLLTYSIEASMQRCEFVPLTNTSAALASHAL
jgi:hypothetical protein